MKDFDKARAERRYGEEERTFQIHGEVFILRAAIHPDALARYDAITAETGIAETLQIVDDTIVQMIEPFNESEERYLAIRDDHEDPVTVEDLLDLVRWVVEAQTGRPTGKPADSSAGRARTAPPSTAPSSLQAVPQA